MTDMERISRILCTADGHNPDDDVLAFRNAEIGARGHAVVRATVKSWVLYFAQAAAVLDHLHQVKTNQFTQKEPA